MCGIAGILELDGSACDPEHVGTFVDALTHRGPDGRGVFTDGPVGLGHRRLAILDLSELGRQPMSCIDGRYTITYNGEIFNFLELRRELEAAGLRFRSSADTEVIAAAYHHWGSDCVFRFNGMWAFAIWDAQKRELFLSRDRFGVKPLRYLATPKRFAFASELKAFFRLPGFTPRENAREMHFALACLNESREQTLLEGVTRLPAGHNMIVSDRGVRVWRWWRTHEHLPQVPRKFSDQVAEFRELFFDAVRLRLRSDVPVASALSGGVDSSSIVCSLAHMDKTSERQAVDFHHAFVATFAGTPWDEQEYAEPVIQKAGANAHMIAIDPETVVANLQQYARDFEMVGSALLIPLWLTYREFRKFGIVVSLDGHGADETLAGYSDTLDYAISREGALRTRPLRTLDLVRTLHGVNPEGRPGVAEFIAKRTPGMTRLGRALEARRAPRGIRATDDAAPPPSRTAWVKPWTEPVSHMDAEDAAAARAMGDLNGALYAQVHGSWLPSILRKFDRCSMAHGVEIRMPFLDWRLVCFEFALPEESKAGGGFTKRVLREAMRGVLPEKVRTRKPKRGFGSPLADWFNGPLGDWVVARTETRRFLESDAWNGPAIRDYVRARHATRQWTFPECYALWPFIQADLWREAYFP